MNELSFEQRDQIKKLLLAGNSIRQIESVVGCAKNTVSRYRKLYEVSASCGCGKPAGHNGWCWYRLQFSPTRSGWIQKQWHKREPSNALGVIATATNAAREHGHDLGPFVWSAHTAASLAYAVCRTCGKTVRVFGRENQWSEHFENWPKYAGNAVTDRCLTPEQRAAEQQARNKKREEREQWQSAKQSLREARQYLRRPNSQTTGSPPEPTSRG